ncbi:transcriptional regulator [Elizabethkingia anophelis]|nr:transcriptional regulator [Elizabethkingia anophelis]
MEKNCLETLQKRRRELNYSQEYVAEKLEMTQKAYSDIENGKTILKSETRLKLAKMLELKPDEICPIAYSCSNILKTKNKELISLLIQNNIEIPEHLL